MPRPTSVTICESGRVVVQISPLESHQDFIKLGFNKSENYENVYLFRSDESVEVYRMCETLRDLGIPFSTHRILGADYALEVLRNEGFVTGTFKRINFFGNDRDEDAPYRIEEF